MYIDKEHFDNSIQRILDRFEMMERQIKNLSQFMNLFEGERLLDNQDVCQLLKVSKRTLQRYRTSGLLKYKTIMRKTYYREKDVHEFIRLHFDK